MKDPSQGRRFLQQALVKFLCDVRRRIEVHLYPRRAIAHLCAQAVGVRQLVHKRSKTDSLYDARDVDEPGQKRMG